MTTEKPQFDSNLPVVDDPNLREKQMKRFTESIGEIGDYARETKKAAKINFWLGIGMTCLILLVVVLALWKGGGLGGFLDLESSARSFNCTSGELHDKVRTYSDADTFQKLYGGECILLKRGVPV